MKRILSVVLALATAALPSVSAAVEVEGPMAERGAGVVVPVLPAVELKVGAAGFDFKNVDLSAQVPAAAQNLGVSSSLLSAQKAADAARTAASQALSAKAQAAAVLPAASEGANPASARGRAEQVFSGARAAHDGEADFSAGGDAGAVSASSTEGASGPELGRPTGRGPPSRREPPRGGGGNRGDGGNGWSSKKVLSLVVLAAVATFLAVTPGRAAAIQTLAAQVHTVSSDFSHHGPVLGLVSAVAALGYDFSNIVGFLYPLTQVHALFKARSGKVSMAQQITGLGSSLLLAFNMFYLNHPGASTLFSAYQNLFGGLTFGVILGQVIYYNKRPGKDGEKPSALKVLLQTGVVIAGVAAATTVIGMALTAGLPLLHVAPLIIPFQMILGFGFAYLTLPGYLKIEREKSVGAASFGTTAMFFLANSCLVVWALYRMATLPGLALAPAMTAVGVFAAVATISSHLAFRWLGSLKWKWIPENRKILGRPVTKNSLIDLAAFVAVSLFMTGLVAAGYGILRGVIAIPLAQRHDFLTFLFYLVDVILASTSAVLTMRAFRRYKKNEPGAE